MATPANTVIESTRVNREESVQQAIRDISPLDTPMLTMGKEVKLSARYSEFLTDSLQAVDASNAHLDGDNDTIGASPAVTRLANRTQIVKKTAAVSGTTEAVNLYGTKSELAYQMAKRYSMSAAA